MTPPLCRRIPRQSSRDRADYGSHQRCPRHASTRWCWLNMATLRALRTRLDCRHAAIPLCNVFALRSLFYCSRHLLPETTVPPATRELPSIRVLICHSDPLIAAGVAATLQEKHFQLVSQTSDTIGRFCSADVAIADYDSGMRLLGSGEVPGERIIILTHRYSRTSICDALEQGVWGYLLLGCSVEELVQSIRSVHGGTRALGPQVAARIAESLVLPLLTPRESEVLHQIILGLSNKRIALELSLSEGTVKAHVKSILAKLGAISRTHAVTLARRYGILSEEGDLSARSAQPGPRLHFCAET